ncbi:MAG: redoxin domain-containing protein [Thermoleophilia bacterium]|nr:redoxin domain-containing protein [Thermoleophilia bacterium]PHX81390.1 MAG: peroxiredoxin [Thermoleophilia bacterium]
MPEIGDIAPDFTLKETFDTSVTLSDYRGKQNVLLFFHPFSYTEICEGEICELRDDARYERDDLVILNVACDAWPIRQAYKEQLGANGVFLADFWPHGVASKAYGVFDEEWGTCMRGTFLIDMEGVIREKTVNMFIGDRRDQSNYLDSLS